MSQTQILARAWVQIPVLGVILVTDAPTTEPCRLSIDVFLENRAEGWSGCKGRSEAAAHLIFSWRSHYQDAAAKETCWSSLDEQKKEEREATWRSRLLIGQKNLIEWLGRSWQRVSNPGPFVKYEWKLTRLSLTPFSAFVSQSWTNTRPVLGPRPSIYSLPSCPPTVP